MIDTGKLEELINQAMVEEDAFLVDYNIDAANSIHIKADTKEGISLEKLGRISRTIESSLDRDEEDFAIEVSSPGVGDPLMVKEQYTKNLGRPATLTLQNGQQQSGTITEYNGQAVTLKWKERVPKEKGKGKHTVEREANFDLKDIVETRLEIRFK